ncbi:hypothetical protein P8452_58706 [Trifolium repens]|nr:hypothetical protein P8452_58706 [Trifolium repens]
MHCNQVLGKQCCLKYHKRSGSSMMFVCLDQEAAEVLRRLSKLRDSSSLSAESSMSLQNVEKRLKDHKSALVALGTETTSALLSFEEQQQHISLQSLSTMSDIN